MGATGKGRDWFGGPQGVAGDGDLREMGPKGGARVGGLRWSWRYPGSGEPWGFTGVQDRKAA